MPAQQIARSDLAPSRALVARHASSPHVRRALATSCAVIAPVSAWIGVIHIGALGAVALACGLLAACFGMTRSASVRRLIDQQAVQNARAKRESGRQHAMYRATAARREQYTVLRRLVEDIERWDPIEAQRFEVEELLDYFVRLSVGHQRCAESLGVSAAATSLSMSPESAMRARRSSAIAARRSRHHAKCNDQLQQIADELDSIDELIRLIAQRVACAKFAPQTDGAIERRIAELDELEAAMTQLTA